MTNLTTSSAQPSNATPAPLGVTTPVATAAPVREAPHKAASTPRPDVRKLFVDIVVGP